MGRHDPFTDVADADMRAGSGLKWHAFAPDVLPMWVAEMDARPAASIVSAVTEALASGNTGYPHGTAFANAMRRFAVQRWGWDFDVADAVPVADVMTGIREVLALVTRPGDPVVITPPVYGPFFDVVELAGRRRIDAVLGDDGRLDLATLEHAMATAAAQATGTAALLLCNPHNPTGVVHTRDELVAVADMARQHRVRVVVDEIHAPLTLPGTTFVPWLTIPGAADGYSVLSASKGWNLAALKAGLVVAGPEASDELATMPELVRHGPSHMGMLAQATALEHGTHWLDDTRTAIADNHGLLAELVASRMPSIGLCPARATYLAWLDFRSTPLATDPAGQLVGKARVALSGGDFFGPGGDGHARMNVATAPWRVREAVDRIADVLGDAG